MRAAAMATTTSAAWIMYSWLPLASPTSMTCLITHGIEQVEHGHHGDTDVGDGKALAVWPQIGQNAKECAHRLAPDCGVETLHATSLRDACASYTRTG